MRAAAKCLRRMRGWLCGLAAGLVLGAGGIAALAAVGDEWDGSGGWAHDGSSFYSDNDVAVYGGRTLTASFFDATQHGPGYTLRAAGKFVQGPDTWAGVPGPPWTFVFQAKAVKLYDEATGALVCSKGRLVAGGRIQPYTPADPHYITNAVIDVTFPSACSVLPGEQFISTSDNSSLGFRNLRFHER
jgi:hypothetical protein